MLLMGYLRDFEHLDVYLVAMTRHRLSLLHRSRAFQRKEHSPPSVLVTQLACQIRTVASNVVASDCQASSTCRPV